MAFLVLVTLGSAALGSSAVVYPTVLAVALVTAISTNSMFFQQTLSTGYLVLDEISLFLIFITVFVIFISYLFTLSSPISSSGTLWLMFLCCAAVFSLDSMFFLYLFYELSLLPILYIILKWGSYPERSQSSLMLLLYTSVFSFPFLFFLFLFYSQNHSFCFSYFSALTPSSPLPFTLMVFLTFAVNLPIYGLHFWLPIAHVEAPTFGSMVLAGVLLNLGGVGLIRFTTVCNYQSLSPYLLGYLLISLLLVTVICCVQTDFNRLVAYSSVSHIIVVPISLLSASPLSINALLLVMLFHGLSSPVLFMLVSFIYSSFSTRQLILTRGVLLLSPLTAYILVLAFLFSLSAPPFPSFLGEVFFITATFPLTCLIAPSFLLFALISIVYNLNWLSSLVFSSPSSSSHSCPPSFLLFLSVVSSIIFSFLLLTLVSFM